MKKVVKRILIIGIILLILSGGFFIFSQSKGNVSQTPQSTTKAYMGNFVDYVEADGKILGKTEIDIKPKVNGIVSGVYAKNGEVVKQGQLIASLETKDIEKMYKDARNSLSAAKLSLESIQTSKNLNIKQAEIALIQAEDAIKKLELSQRNNTEQLIESKNNAEENLNKAYDNALSLINLAFADFATIINDSRNILFLSETIPSQDKTNTDSDKNLINDINSIWNVEIPKYWQDIISSSIFDTDEDRKTLETFAKKSVLSFNNAKSEYAKNAPTHQTLTTLSSREEIENVLNLAINTAKVISDNQKDLNNLYDFYVNYSNERKRTVYYNITTYNLTLKANTTKISTAITNLVNSKSGSFGIDTLKISLANINRSILQDNQNNPLDLVSARKNMEIQKERLNLAKSDIDIKTQQIAVAQAQNNFDSVSRQMEDYYIKAPFDGILGNVGIKENDPISQAIVVCKIISDEKIAEINVNEADTTKLKLDQASKITFEAFDNVEMSGKVLEINTVPELDESGVSNYKIKILIDKNDEKFKNNFGLIKTGMNVTSKIILTQKDNVLLLNNSGIQEDNNGFYVEILDETKQPKRIDVQVGLKGVDDYEILSGISDGQEVLIKQRKKLDKPMMF